MLGGVVCTNDGSDSSGQGSDLEAAQFAPVVGYLMTPIALVGYVLALWRLGADLNWLDEFFIHQGIVLALAGVAGDRDCDASRRESTKSDRKRRRRHAIARGRAFTSLIS